MDRTEEYRGIVMKLFQEVEEMMPSQGDIITELVIGSGRGHFQLGEVGWDGKRRVDDIFLHVDIRDGKVWVQHDGTNLKIAELLLKAGIPRESIILAFHRPDMRIHTEFAVA